MVFTPRDTDNYDYSSITLTKTVDLTVNKAEQTLTGLPDLVKINGGADFIVTPDSNASAENPNITFQSSDSIVIDFDASGNFVIKGDGTANITVLADETANYKSATATFEIRVLADTANLKDVIDAAQDLIDGLQTNDIGNGNGQYPQDAVDKLQDAIDKAKDVANDSGATQAEVDQAKEDLLKAIEDAGALKKGCYTDATWNALQAALAAGRTGDGKRHPGGSGCGGKGD